MSFLKKFKTSREACFFYKTILIFQQIVYTKSEQNQRVHDWLSFDIEFKTKSNTKYIEIRNAKTRNDENLV